MSIIKYLKLRFLTRKIHSILNSWSGWDYSVTRQYDIDRVPLPSELKKGMDKPTINLIDGKKYIIFFFTKPYWSIYVGLMVSENLNPYWVESCEDTFYKSSRLDEPPIPDDIKEEFISLIIENKNYYIETVKDWVSKAKKEYLANYGR